VHPLNGARNNTSPAEWLDKITACELVVGETRWLLASDSRRGTIKMPRGSVSSNINDTALAEAIFRGLADAASLTHALRLTLLGALFGMLSTSSVRRVMVN